jgi:hypothetical protein
MWILIQVPIIDVIIRLRSICTSFSLEKLIPAENSESTFFHRKMRGVEKLMVPLGSAPEDLSSECLCVSMVQQS